MIISNESAADFGRSFARASVVVLPDVPGDRLE
jgi:hypothetical protein